FLYRRLRRPEKDLRRSPQAQACAAQRHVRARTRLSARRRFSPDRPAQHGGGAALRVACGAAAKRPVVGRPAHLVRHPIRDHAALALVRRRSGLGRLEALEERAPMTATAHFDYETFTTRNFGFVSKAEQDKLRAGAVFVAGVGGMGGACLNALVRAG